MNIDAIIIRHGSHNAPSTCDLDNPEAVQACAMEASYLRWALRQGMPAADIVRGWTDHLGCVDPVSGASSATGTTASRTTRAVPPSLPRSCWTYCPGRRAAMP